MSGLRPRRCEDCGRVTRFTFAHDRCKSMLCVDCIDRHMGLATIGRGVPPECPHAEKAALAEVIPLRGTR